VGRDLRLYSHENLLEQIQTSIYRNGYYVLEFYANQHKPSSVQTATIETFYLYPSGGTLRDSSFQLLFYDSRYDTYRGFKHPHMSR
jgi:hypothetical protein